MQSLLRDCATLLHQFAAYRLPPALDRRLLWLAENKELLSEAEREELLALVDLAEDRTVEKLRARVLLQQLGEVAPPVPATRP